MLYFSRVWCFIRCQFKKYAVCFHAAEYKCINRLLVTFKAKDLNLRPLVLWKLKTHSRFVVAWKYVQYIYFFFPYVIAAESLADCDAKNSSLFF